MRDKIYMSRAKFNEFTEKLDRLRKVEFPAIRDDMKLARESGGGTHDNAPYEHAALQEKVLMRQISELEELLAVVDIVDGSEIDPSVVCIGTQVRVLDLDDSTESVLVIVGAYETDSASNRISYLAPIAKGLIGKKVDDTAEICVPKGVVRLRILSIEKAEDW